MARFEERFWIGNLMFQILFPYCRKLIWKRYVSSIASCIENYLGNIRFVFLSEILVSFVRILDQTAPAISCSWR